MGQSQVSPDPGSVLAGLIAGNRRFAEGDPQYGHHISAAAVVSEQQHPLAVVIGCIDSRVPLEAVFDQDFGGICVVRTGGHVLDRAVLGSVEFAVGELGVPLVMVLGHKRCGAVDATIDAVRAGKLPEGPLGYLVEQIAPAVREVGDDPPSLAVTSAHVRRTVVDLHNLAILREGLATGAVDVVGAVYDLDTGRVDLLG